MCRWAICYLQAVRLVPVPSRRRWTGGPIFSPDYRMHTIHSTRERWRCVGWLTLFLFCSVVSLLCATRPTMAVLGVAYVWCTIRALVDLFRRRLPQWRIEFADRLHYWCDEEGYLIAAMWRAMRFEHHLYGFHYSAFVACCRKIRSEHQQTLFCCRFADYVRAGLVSEETMNDLLEHSTWPDAQIWLQRFLNDPFPTVGGADSPRA